jgi:hypothetical protein
MFSALIRLFFGVAENTFCSPTWWDSLQAHQKAKIEELIMNGVIPFMPESKTLLVDDNIDFHGWVCEKVVRINW